MLGKPLPTPPSEILSAPELLISSTYYTYAALIGALPQTLPEVPSLDSVRDFAS